MASNDTIVICPVYNEEATLAEFYQALRQHYSFDILFVDDGSTDGGRHLLKAISNRNTLVMTHSQRQGYGGALLSGFAFSRKRQYERIVTIDGDLQHKPSYLPEFFKALLSTEVVLGSRYVKIGKCLDIPRDRLVINHYIRRLIEVLFSCHLSDPFCGFRGYRRSFLEKTSLTEKSYGLSIEILLEIIRTKTAFREIPVEAIYFKSEKVFLDGLDDPQKRVRYYLGVIERKKKEIQGGTSVSVCEPSP